MIKFIQRLKLLKLDYLIWKCERLHKKWLKAENKLRGENEIRTNWADSRGME